MADKEKENLEYGLPSHENMAINGESLIMGTKPYSYHVDGKEFKTLVLKFIIDALKISEEDFYNKIYPEHGNFETSLIEYINITGWQFKHELNANRWKESWFDFHEKYREYEMVDPIAHHKLSSDEIKFKTSIRKNKRRKTKRH